ncbi:hypothetical protein [Buchnera aphidicola]|uniref:CAF17-like 4Fe-4S cluster assembly/insertion protein YgfZ n=1 Tax=Buchnera aphidicola TaxID=9 RepID=UPI0031B88A42
MKKSIFSFYFKDIFLKDKPLLVFLNNISINIVSGKDSKIYLQNQFTNDITDLKENNYGFGSHCDVNGKIISVFLIFNNCLNNYIYLQRKSISKIQNLEIKKYAIFSKVDIHTSTSLAAYGVFGKNSKIFLEKYFNISFKNNNLIKKNDFIFLKINGIIKRYIIIANYKKIECLENKKNFHFETKKNFLWDLLNMEIGFPILEEKNCRKFFPFSLNLKKFNCISFKKGCYKGQEILSKIKYKNINNKRLFLIYGVSEKIPKIGENIFEYIKNTFIFSGKVLFSIKMNKFVFVQCVLKSTVNKCSSLKINSIKKIFFYIKKIYI